MKLTQPADPLTEAELDRLGEFLANCKGGKAMNVEEVDGFFAALIAGPELVMPSEYHPEVFGGDLGDACEFESLEEAQEILGLLMRHWNAIAGTLNNQDVYEPVLLEDETGVALGNDWARGFMRGMHMRHEGWAELLADDDHAGRLVPVLMLYHEHDEDPKTRTNPIGPEQREDMIVGMTAGLVQVYRYFRNQAQPNGRRGMAPYRANKGKVGRNNPCPCGSGKKHKRCCGGTIVQ